MTTQKRLKLTEAESRRYWSIYLEILARAGAIRIDGRDATGLAETFTFITDAREPWAKASAEFAR